VGGFVGDVFDFSKSIYKPVLGLGSGILGGLGAKKIKQPKSTAPPELDPVKAKKAADAAGEKKKQMSLAAYSTMDTFATGGLGLGKPGPQFLKYNSLLGAP
jgi:hypothetical protein